MPDIHRNFQLRTLRVGDFVLPCGPWFVRAPANSRYSYFPHAVMQWGSTCLRVALRSCCAASHGRERRISLFGCTHQCPSSQARSLPKVVVITFSVSLLRILLAERTLGGDTPPLFGRRIIADAKICTYRRLSSPAASLRLELSAPYEARLTGICFRFK
jgi:hypothetical protein